VWLTFENVTDGQLTFQEYAAGFDMFDTNGNGTIDRNEMLAAM
jgi:Ca2+-binding EF-hand superfamily protein